MGFWAEGAKLTAVPSEKTALACDLPCLRGFTLPSVALNSLIFITANVQSIKAPSLV